MHVAIVSQDPYPYIRVEREVYLLLNNGFKVSFIGRVGGECSVFSGKYEDFQCIEYGFNNLALNLIEPYLTREAVRLKRVLDHVKPDVVLAINPLIGVIVDKTNYPLVVDDLECFYEKVKYYPLFGLKNMSVLKRIKYFLGTIRRKWIYRVRKIEVELARKHPLILVSGNAKKYYVERFNLDPGNIYVIPNYPVEREFNGINDIIVRDKPIFGYIGVDIPYSTPYRDMSIAVDVLCSIVEKYGGEVYMTGVNYSYKCFKGHRYPTLRDIYHLFQMVDYGLLTHTPNPIHRLVTMNKAYHYAVVGSIPVVTWSYQAVIEDFHGQPIVIVNGFDKDGFRRELYRVFTDLVNMDREERFRKRRTIMDYTRRNLVMDKYSGVLVEALNKAS